MTHPGIPWPVSVVVRLLGGLWSSATSATFGYTWPAAKSRKTKFPTNMSARNVDATIRAPLPGTRPQENAEIGSARDKSDQETWYHPWTRQNLSLPDYRCLKNCSRNHSVTYNAVFAQPSFGISRLEIRVWKMTFFCSCITNKATNPFKLPKAIA